MANKKVSASIESEDNLLPETEASKEFINFFVNELKDLCWAEKHQLKLLHKMYKSATVKIVKNSFENHLATTELQIERLEQIFELLNESPKVRKCEAMAELADELDDIIDETEKGSSIREAGLILVAKKIENYEIATYGILLQWAKTMGDEDIIALLEETLSEEIASGEMLSSLAEKNVWVRDRTKKQQEEDKAMVAAYNSVNLNGKKFTG